MHPLLSQNSQDPAQIALKKAQKQVLEVESTLSAEQAQVNRFRLHYHLQLGGLIQQVQTLQMEKQRGLVLHRLGKDGLIPLFQRNPVSRPSTDSDLKYIYRQLVKRFHPDLAPVGAQRVFATTIMTAINIAYEQGDTNALIEFSGGMIDLPVPSSAENDQPPSFDPVIYQKIVRLQIRTKKLQRQLDAFRAEKVTQLWLYHCQIEADGRNWIEVVQAELQQEIEKLQTEILQMNG